MNPKVTIVTVVYNDVNNIDKTINSIINQSYDNIEYLIIDGGSVDGTTDKIKEYSNKISYWISEPDKGVYDAMNKAIKIATGEWIIFMNSNDQFYSSSVVENVINQSIKEDIIFGNHVDPQQKELIVKPRSLNKLWKGMPFNHQSCFVRTSVHKSKLFDLKYKISAVHDLFYFWYKENKTFKYVDETIAIYDMTGMSSSSLIWIWDNFRINMKYNTIKMPIVVLRLIYVFLNKLKKEYLR